MRQIFFITTLVLSIFVVSCQANHLSGVYVCDQSTKKADTTIQHGSYAETTLDLTCTFTQFDFKGKNSVVIKMANGDIASSYVIDQEYVRIKGTGSDILLKLQDPNTLIGEGVAEGTYHKK